MAAALMEAAEGDLEFKDGAFRVVGTDKVIPLTEVAKAFYAPMGPMTEKLGVGLEAQGTYSTNPPNHPNGSHVAEIEIDPETGEVQGRPLFRGRRSRRRAQSDDRARSDPWRRRAGHRPGADRACDLRQGIRADAVGDLHGLRHAARRPVPGNRDASRRGAVEDQSARRQGHRRKRHDRRAADRDQRHPRCAQAAMGWTRSTCRRRRRGSGTRCRRAQEWRRAAAAA